MGIVAEKAHSNFVAAVTGTVPPRTGLCRWRIGRTLALSAPQRTWPRLSVGWGLPFARIAPPEAQAIFCRRRHQPSTPPLAKIRPGIPAPAPQWPALKAVRLSGGGAHADSRRRPLRTPRRARQAWACPADPIDSASPLLLSAGVVLSRDALRPARDVAPRISCAMPDTARGARPSASTQSPIRTTRSMPVLQRAAYTGRVPSSACLLSLDP